MARFWQTSWGAAILCVAALGACSAPGPREGFAATDDFEPMSRVFLDGNKRIDRFVIRPAAQGYEAVTPALFQHLIGNGLSHLGLATDFANYLLQGDVDGTLNTFGRFTLNTIVGAGGLLDPATEFGLRRAPTDFGLTLASYGVGEGSYLVLPILGPTTVRDAAGTLVDRAFSPTTYIGAFTPLDAVGPTVTGLGLVDTRTRLGGFIDEVFYEADDSYVTLRTVYLQRRRALAAGDDNAGDNLPDILEDEPLN